MIPKMLREFVIQLQQATEQGQLVWNKAGDDAYYCNHKNYTLHVYYHYDGEIDQYSYLFRIIVDEKNTPFSVSQFEIEDYEIMKRLYCAVVANANRANEYIRDFFTDL